ncbi:trypsin-like peptidase domain-containing protein [Pseudohoeflea coraliihabitans]|uniref:Serine protease n=1 Tax=Pseudohoeflea coraliihabitans TaxID=2860393 RepID=A0ABS6WKN5_9HYPH|nr:trypsin-like peptidase domain-containing protein [Pseudohoeflea sp. DP4N28-3]MBW3096499.1 hypothetical protein [Pseudohoeflea sp. DP4N28-3]
MNSILLPSVKSLYIQLLFEDTILSTGTAFSVQTSQGAMLITNRHNLTGRDQNTDRCLHNMGGLPTHVRIHHHATGALGTWIEKTEALYKDGVRRWLEHPALGSRADVVALPLVETDGVDLHPYDLYNEGCDFVVGPADPVSVIGFPFGLTAHGKFPIWATGFIATEPIFDYEDLPVFLVDCRSRKGQSGSPVIAQRNSGTVTRPSGAVVTFGGPVSQFLGIYSGRINNESDLGFVWKTRAIQEIIAFN